MESTLRSTSAYSRRIGDRGRQYGRFAAHVGLAILMVPFAACQGLVGASEPPQPRLAIDKTTLTSSPGGPRSPSNVTYAVQRGTITDSLTISGRVVPAVASQVTLQRPGIVTAIQVRSGQAVKKGEALVEVAVDDSVIEDLETRATLAELEYQSQAARVTEIKRGAGPDQLAAARAEVTKAQADVQRAMLEQQLAQQEAQHDQRTAGLARDDRDRRRPRLVELLSARLTRPRPSSRKRRRVPTWPGSSSTSPLRKTRSS